MIGRYVFTAAEGSKTGYEPTTRRRNMQHGFRYAFMSDISWAQIKLMNVKNYERLIEKEC